MHAHTPQLSKSAGALSWICQIVAAVIMAQTLYFKFSGAPEPVHIFSTLGAEPWGRYGTAVAELVAALLLFVSRTAALGALLSIGLMVGALGAHLTKLGIEVNVPGVGSDGGLLFVLALVTLVASLVVLWLRRFDLPIVGCKLAHAKS